MRSGRDEGKVGEVREWGEGGKLGRIKGSAVWERRGKGWRGKRRGRGGKLGRMRGK